jgi:hypothetical protein
MATSAKNQDRMNRIYRIIAMDHCFRFPLAFHPVHLVNPVKYLWKTRN